MTSKLVAWRRLEEVEPSLGFPKDARICPKCGGNGKMVGSVLPGSGIPAWRLPLQNTTCDRCRGMGFVSVEWMGRR